jgi:hypothetical protein
MNRKENNTGGNSKYYIDYIHSNRMGSNFYHQLVRRQDEAILCAYHNLDLVYAHCFKAGINRSDVATL